MKRNYLDLKTTVAEELEFFFGRKWHTFTSAKQQKLINLWPDNPVSKVVAAADHYRNEIEFSVIELQAIVDKADSIIDWKYEDSSAVLDSEVVRTASEIHDRMMMESDFTPMTASEAKMRIEEANTLTEKKLQEAYEKLVNPPIILRPSARYRNLAVNRRDILAEHKRILDKHSKS